MDSSLGGLLLAKTASMPGDKRLSASMGLARAVESAVLMAVDHHLAHGNAGITMLVA